MSAGNMLFLEDNKAVGWAAQLSALIKSRPFFTNLWHFQATPYIFRPRVALSIVPTILPGLSLGYHLEYSTVVMMLITTFVVIVLSIRAALAIPQRSVSCSFVELRTWGDNNIHIVLSSLFKCNENFAVVPNVYQPLRGLLQHPRPFLLRGLLGDSFYDRDHHCSNRDLGRE